MVLAFTLSLLLCGILLNVPMFVASCVVQDIGGAMVTPVGFITLVRVFPRSELLLTANYVIILTLIVPSLG